MHGGCCVVTAGRTISVEACSSSCRSARAREQAELDHETAVLDDVDAGPRKALSGRVVANAELKPDGFRALGENVVEMSGNVAVTAKYVDKVHTAGNVDEAAVHTLTENLVDIRMIDR